MPSLTTRILTKITDKVTNANTTPTTTSLLLSPTATSSSSSSSSSSSPSASSSSSLANDKVMATHPTTNISSNLTAASTTPTNSNATTTCTFSTNNDYRQHFQQTKQQNQQLHQESPPSSSPQLQFKQHHHFYSHQQQNSEQQQQHQHQHQQPHLNSSPPLPPSHTQLDETGSGSGSSSSVVGAILASAAIASAANSSSVTFNGNAMSATASISGGVENAATSSTAASPSASGASGNYSGVVENANGRSGNFTDGIVTKSNGNSNIISSTFSKTPTDLSTTTPIIMTTTATTSVTTSYNTILANNKLETSSTAGSSSLNGSIKKSSSSSHASREDIASLGGGSSINSQSTTAIHNINNSNINNNYTKDNCLQNYHYNAVCDGRDGNDDDDDDDDLGPLPPKWETAYTERGELYFIDHNTGTSHWLDPRLSKFQKKSLEDCSDDELPYGWEKIEDSLYGTYYIDHVNRRTQYENPVLEAKRRAAEQRKQLRPPPPPHQSHTFSPPPGNAQTVGRLDNGGVGGGNGMDDATSSTLTTISNDSQYCPSAAISSMGGIQKSSPPLLPYKFTRNPAEMQGTRITTRLVKSTRGLGITIVGGDDAVEEFLQIKSIVPNGPAWMDGKLQTGDILVYVNDTCVLGCTHHEMVNIFQSILPGETVTLEICRGYPLPFDPNDPNTEVVTTIAVDGIISEPEKQRRILLDLNMDGNYNFLDVSDGPGGCDISDISLKNLESVAATTHTADSSGDFILVRKPEILKFAITKGVMGFGFTIADSAYGQKVKKILDRNCCKQLQEGDILLEINSVSVRNKTHTEVVQVLKDCSKTVPTMVKIQRGGSNFNGSIGGSAGTKLPNRKNQIGNNNNNTSTTTANNNSNLYRSKTPTADLYSTQKREILPIRPKTPLVDTRARARVQTPNNELNDAEVAAATNGIGSISSDATNHRCLTLSASDTKSPQPDAKSTTSLQELDTIHHEIPFMDPYPKLVTSLSERLAEATLVNDTGGDGQKTHVSHSINYNNHEYASVSCYPSMGAINDGGYAGQIYEMSPMSPMSPATNMTSLSQSAQHTNQHLINSNTVYSPTMHYVTTTAPTPTYHHDSCYCYDCQDYQRYKYRHQQTQHNQLHPIQTNYYTLQHQQQQPQPLYSPLLHAPPAASTSTTTLQAAHIQNERMQKRVNELLNDRRRVGFNSLDTHSAAGLGSGYHPVPISQQQSPGLIPMAHQNLSNWNYNNMLQPVMAGGGVPQMGGGLSNGGTLTPIFRQNIEEDDHHQYELSEVTLERQALGFGFRIVGGTEEGSQVTVGHIVPGGAADNDHRIATGDEILSIDGINVVNSSHHKVVSLMGEAALRGQVTMILRRRTTLRHFIPALPTTLRYPASARYPYDVIVSRSENEGFGFVIISSSNQYYGSTIGKLIPGSPADRCGELKVGDRIIAVNRIEIAGMSHGDVVQLIKESGLHVRLTIGCPKEGNPMLTASAQASPGSQFPQTQHITSSTSPASGSLAATPSSLLQPSQLQQQQHQIQQQQFPQTDTPAYFERNTQSGQHPQL